MKNFFAILILTLLTASVKSEQKTINSPDGNLSLSVSVEDGIPFYSVKYKDVIMLEDSPIGLITNIGDFSRGMKQFLLMVILVSIVC